MDSPEHQQATGTMTPTPQEVLAYLSEVTDLTLDFLFSDANEVDPEQMPTWAL